MGEWNFDTRACIRALKKLGFYIANKGRRSSHDKYCPPELIHELLRQRRERHVFIMIPRHGVMHCQTEIVNELRNMGGEALVQEFKSHL